MVVFRCGMKLIGQVETADIAGMAVCGWLATEPFQVVQGIARYHPPPGRSLRTGKSMQDKATGLKHFSTGEGKSRKWPLGWIPFPPSLPLALCATKWENSVQKGEILALLTHHCCYLFASVEIKSDTRSDAGPDLPGVVLEHIGDESVGEASFQASFALV